MDLQQQLLEKISASELRDLIDQIDHQLSHLQRSQLELLHALEADPSDIDCRDAHEENNVVIDQKERAILVMKAHLKSIDLAYCTETYLENVEDHRQCVAVTPSLIVSLGEYHPGAVSQNNFNEARSIELLSTAVTESTGVFL